MDKKQKLMKLKSYRNLLLIIKEYNNAYKNQMEEKGLIVSGLSPNGKLVEIVELKNHPYFIAAQFHPEFKSRPDRPHPLFAGLVKASLSLRGC